MQCFVFKMMIIQYKWYFFLKRVFFRIKILNSIWLKYRELSHLFNEFYNSLIVKRDSEIEDKTQ
jgi:hypothetical protein